MKSPHRSKVLIPGKRWLYMKPYARFTSYDQYYVNLASRLLWNFKKEPSLSDQHFEVRDAAEKLALILTSYAEDIVNEIGIWRVFTETNKAQLGYYLPFTEEDGTYEPGIFDFRDLRYLVWHFFNKAKGLYMAPDSSMIKAIAEMAWDVLEPAIDDAPETDFYRKYLVIPDNAPFFEVKLRLHWFALSSYVLGFEFGWDMANSYKKMLEDKTPLTDTPEFLYQLKDDYAFIKASSYCGLRASQWLASVAGASPKMKTQMLNLRNRIMGMFQYQGATNTHYRMRPAHQKKTLSVVKASVDIDPQTKEGDWLFMTILPYEGEFWMSGMMAAYGPGPEDKAPPVAFPFALKSEDAKAAAREYTAKLEADFRAEFGDIVYISRDWEDLKTRMRAFWMRNRARIAAENTEPTPPLDEPLIDAINGDLPQKPGTAAVFVPGEGIMFDPGAGNTLDLLKQAELSDFSLRKELMGNLLDMHPVSLDYVLREAPENPVWFPVKQSQCNVRPYLGFLSRYENPGIYLPVEPRVNIQE